MRFLIIIALLSSLFADIKQESIIRFNGGFRVGENQNEFWFNQIGLKIKIKPNSSHCVVVDSFGLSSDLKDGDLIISVNGKPVEKYNVSWWGWDGSSAFSQIGDALIKKNLSLGIYRGSVKKEVKIDVRKSKFYHVSKNCNNTKNSLNKCLKYLSNSQKPDNYWGGGQFPAVKVQSAVVALTMMNAGKTKHVSSFIKNIPKHYSKCMWSISYNCTVALEYYKINKTERNKSLVKELLRRMEEGTHANGRHGHTSNAVGYYGKGMNAITAHVYLNFVLAEKLGFRIDSKKKMAVVEHLKKSIKSDGLSYHIGSTTNEGFYRTSIYALALRLDGDIYNYNKMMNALSKRSQFAMNGHALQQLSLMWYFMACKTGGNKHINHAVKNWQWFFLSSEATRYAKREYNIEKYYLLTGRDDAYLDRNIVSHTVHAMIFSLPNSNLRILK